MRLYPLNPTSRLTINISTISRRLGLQVLVNYLPETRRRLRGLILVTDGTPDDYVVAILSHHLNEEETFAIVKPERPRFDALSFIPNYLSQLRGLSKIAVFMDQERDKLDSIYERVKEKLGGCKENFMRDRLCLYNCFYGGREYKVILIINGLNEIEYKRHTIEDHLLQAANQFFDVNISDARDSKDVWWNRLKEIHDKVYNRLKRVGKGEISKIFPQQFEGLSLLKD